MQDTIAIDFDFDDTLAPDNTSSFLEALGVDIKRFWSKTVQARIDTGWDPVPAYLYKMIQLSRSADPSKTIAKDGLYASHGKIDFPCNIVSFTDKTRYISHVSKGVYRTPSRGKPFKVNRKIPSQELRVPLDQIIFVGDGYTDIACFSVVSKFRAVAIAVESIANKIALRRTSYQG